MATSSCLTLQSEMSWAGDDAGARSFPLLAFPASSQGLRSLPLILLAGMRIL